MSQNSLVLPTTGTVSGLQMTQNVNNALDTINTLSSGASAPGSPEAGQFWHDSTNNILKLRSLDNSTWIPLFNLNETSYLSTPFGIAPLGQCQFKCTSGTVCTLLPYNGNKIIFPSGALAVLPASGIATTITNACVNGAGGQTLSAATLYYAYLANISGSYVIDWSTTSYATDSATGITIKSGDGTRILVGMAYISSGPVFTNSLTNRLVRSWFNDPGINGTNTFTTVRATSSNSYVELNAEIRIGFISWTNEILALDYNANLSGGTVTDNMNTAIGFDGSTTPYAQSNTNVAGSGLNTIHSAAYKMTGLAEGLHYVTLLGVSYNSIVLSWTNLTTLNLFTRKV